MSQIIPINIPTYIGDQNYSPNRVLPRLLFFNGMLECEEYYIESGSLTNSGVPIQQSTFPYFDNYNVVTGSFPTTDSYSLLFNNEAASYGEIPTGSLYTTYWETYVNLLYNPKTRLFNCEAIIPLADYYKMELNDIVEWRGNYYHLRAINEYNLKNGECKIQLLGPLEPPVISNLLPEKDCGFNFTSSLFTTTTSTTSTTTTSTTTAPPTVFYRLTVQQYINDRTCYYVDFNGISRSFFIDTGAPISDPGRLLTFRFAAQKNSVSFSNPLGCTLTLLQEPFTPNIQQYNVNFAPSILANRYIGYQEAAGNVQQYSNYSYVSSICIVSGSVTNTSSNFTLTNTGAC